MVTWRASPGVVGKAGQEGLASPFGHEQSVREGDARAAEVVEHGFHAIGGQFPDAGGQVCPGGESDRSRRRQQARLELAPGDVALVRGGPDHHIAHEPAGTCLPPEQFRARHAGDERSGDRRASVFLCGAYRFFQQALGQAPIQYLTDWRMTLARDHLRTGELTLAQIAARTSYASPYAFAAAFRRHHGRPPGQWRHQQLDQPDINKAAPADDIHTR